MITFSDVTALLRRNSICYLGSRDGAAQYVKECLGLLKDDQTLITITKLENSAACYAKTVTIESLADTQILNSLDEQQIT